MTRINLIAPTMMSGPHLLAEYRELPRIFTLAYEACLRSESPNDPRNPREYTLGPGHVRFFYPRLKFLERRFELLVDEMWDRGWTPNFTSPPPCYDLMSRHWCQDYVPTVEAIELNLARLRERDPEHYS
ncbi:MAG: endonuclease [Hyphomicrobiaceae bacterium]|nr:MAG: endonuclease [Hyphomicrobiaceae bacterium]